MQYIRSCPSCSSELRFPIDRGTLIVKCPNCNHSFNFDPDDPSTFKYGRFDYSLPPSLKSGFKNTIEKIQDIFYLPIYLIKNNFKFPEFGIKKIIPVILIVFIFLNFYRICSQSETKKTKVQLEKNLQNNSPHEEDEFPEDDKKPKIDPNIKPEYEI